MYIGLKHLHSFLPYLLLTVLFLAFVHSLIAYFWQNPHTEGHRKNGLIPLIIALTKLLVGGILYFVSPMSKAGLNNIGAAMKDISSHLKNKIKSIYFGLALVLILSKTPWSAWL